MSSLCPHAPATGQALACKEVRGAKCPTAPKRLVGRGASGLAGWAAWRGSALVGAAHWCRKWRPWRSKRPYLRRCKKSDGWWRCQATVRQQAQRAMAARQACGCRVPVALRGAHICSQIQRSIGGQGARAAGADLQAVAGPLRCGQRLRHRRRQRGKDDEPHRKPGARVQAHAGQTGQPGRAQGGGQGQHRGYDKGSVGSAGARAPGRLLLKAWPARGACRAPGRPLRRQGRWCSPAPSGRACFLRPWRL